MASQALDSMTMAVGDGCLLDLAERHFENHQGLATSSLRRRRGFRRGGGKSTDLRRGWLPGDCGGNGRFPGRCGNSI